ncbi:hypothetical protein, partial [Alienimonas chondri]|uniref:hypothetical protein n=1 Tax=Alienimonas chondri TaxID=2681879 RepID=UPI0014877F0A
MASPFEIFRRNQWLVVGLFGLSIFAFVFMDFLTPGRGGNELFPILLGVLLGGIAAWLISNTTGRAAVMWAAAGAVAGGMFVGLSGNFFGGNVAVPTNEGGLSQTDLNELGDRNRIANQFFASLRSTLAEREDAPEGLADTPLPNFNYTGVRPDPQLPFRQIPNVLGAQTPREYGLVFAHLLGEEADDAGMEVSNDRVNALINSHFGISPTRNEIRDIRTKMGVGETDLFDAIRGEMRHRDMYSLLLPSPTSLPTDAWELYRKLNQTANVAYVELPVEQFVAEAPEPTESQVSELFDEYRDQQPNPVTKLGFLRPAQLSLGYLKTEREAVAETVPEPTDAEVDAFYEANRNTEFRNPRYDAWLIDQQEQRTRDEVDSALDGMTPPAPSPG